MKRKELDYGRLFKAVPASILIVDPDFTILSATDQYLDDTLTREKKIIGKNLFVVFPDNPSDRYADGASKLRKSLNLVLETKAPHAMGIQKYDIPIGSTGEFVERYWSPVNTPVLDDEGNISCIIHRVEDVTEFTNLRSKDEKQRKENSLLRSVNSEMESKISERSLEVILTNEKLKKINEDLLAKSFELQRSNDDLARFAMTASHDIQAPFRIVGSYLNLIEEELKEEELLPKVQDYFGKIYGARERIKNLLADLLQFALVSKSETEEEKVDLKKVVADVLTNLEDNIQEKNAVIVVQGKLPSVIGERSQLLQLFQNLLANAIKFTTKTPQISLTITEQDKMFLFSVQDNGVGIEPQYYDKVFEVFQRLNLQSEFPGTGLGLAICKKIIDHHKGKIWLESDRGKGTTFFFTLPKIPTAKVKKLPRKK